MAALFRWWRAALGRALSEAGSAAERLRESRELPHAGRVVTAYLRSPEGAIASADQREGTVLTALGLAAACTGSAVTAFVAARGGASAASAALAALAPLGWAVARLALFEALDRQADLGSSRRLRTAWAAALLPLGLAWTPILRAIAFLVSVPLTYAGLLGASIVPRRARILCALGFGAEVLAAAAIWVVANGLVFVRALGS